MFEPLEKTPRSLSAGTGKAFLSSDYDSRRYLDTACVVRSSEWWVSPWSVNELPSRYETAVVEWSNGEMMVDIEGVIYPTLARASDMRGKRSHDAPEVYGTICVHGCR